MITPEILISRGFKETNNQFKVSLKRSRKDSPKEVTLSLNKQGKFFLEGEATKKECTIERLDNLIKGIELFNNKEFKSLIINE